MTKRHLPNTSLVLSLGATLLLVPSCRDATQVVLNVHTDLPCTGEAWQGVAIYVGEPGDDVEHTSPTLVSKSCDEGGAVGSLVVTPSGAKDGELGLRVVAGVSANPEDCEERGYDGCIVARRALRFTPHESLQLDVELTADCVSVGCDAQHSCVEHRCVDTDSIAPTSAATPVEPDEITGPSVRCGDNGVRCATRQSTTTGEVCCLSIDLEQQTTFGRCLPPKDCPAESIVLNCDDDTDCPERDPVSDFPSVCTLSTKGEDPWQPSSVQLSECAYAHTDGLGDHFALSLCQERQGCADSNYRCEASYGAPNPLPNYFWCKVQTD
jgi:hypothetical protein